MTVTPQPAKTSVILSLSKDQFRIAFVAAAVRRWSPRSHERGYILS
jgi:hypothetical protein